MNVYRLFFTPIFFNWTPFHLIFYGVFCLFTLKIFLRNLTFIQSVHLTVLSLLTIQLLWELPLNIMHTLSISPKRQYYFLLSYIIRLLPCELLIYTLNKFKFADLKLIVIPSLIMLPLTTMLLGFNRFGYLLRLAYAIPYLLFINKIEGRIQK